MNFCFLLRRCMRSIFEDVQEIAKNVRLCVGIFMHVFARYIDIRLKNDGQTVFFFNVSWTR